MDLKEYLNQSNKNFKCSVELLPDECMIWSGFPIIHNGERVNTRYVSVMIEHIVYQYIEIKGDLWTMDEHGNPKTKSVFKLKGL